MANNDEKPAGSYQVDERIGDHALFEILHPNFRFADQPGVTQLNSIFAFCEYLRVALITLRQARQVPGKMQCAHAEIIRF